MKYTRRNTIRRKITKGRAAVTVLAILVVTAVLVFGPLQRVHAAQATIDSAIGTIVNEKLHQGTDEVFISDQVGYVVYRDDTNNCVYSKTTDGGTTWGAAVAIDSSTNCHNPVIWYDRWTPGDNGTIIHVFVKSATANTIGYNEIDTTNDSVSNGTTAVVINSDKTNTLNPGQNRIFVTKGTNGTMWAGLHDSGNTGDQSWIKKCSASCNTAANWVDATPSDILLNSQVDALMMPLSSGNIMFILRDVTSNVIESEIYTSSTSSWDTSYTTIDAATGNENTTYRGTLTGTINKSTGTIYIAYATDNSTLGTDDDIRTASYSGGSWTNKTDVLTDSTMGITRAAMGLDENTGNIYVAYTAQSTAGTATTADVYFKESTDGMTSWGTQSAALNTASDDLYGLSMNIMSNERLYVTWHDHGTSTDVLYGALVVDLISNTAPAAPTLSAPANAATGVSVTPKFQMRTTDTDNDYLRYKIDICSTSNCSTIVRTVDQTASQTGWTGQDQQTSTAYTGSSTITSSTMASYTYQSPALAYNTQYWWRAYAIDPAGTNAFSAASSISSFTTLANTAPNAPTLSAPANAATGISNLPVFQLSATDTNGDYLNYKIQVCTTSNCSTVAYTIDETSSQSGWSGQNGGGGTGYASGSTATYTFSLAPLSSSTQYWWRAYAIDPAGTNAFSAASSIRSFTTAAASGGVIIQGGTNIAGGTKIEN